MSASKLPEWPTGNRVELYGNDAIDAMQSEITALRAALDQERARIRELAESPPMASISLCCGIVRPGYYAPPTMHNGLCRGRHGGELGKTYYLHDVSALLSGRGEGGDPVAQRISDIDRQWQKQIEIRRGDNDG